MRSTAAGKMPSLPGLAPLDSWHMAPPRPPSLKRRALRHDRLDSQSLPLTEARATRSPMYRKAIVATIWSFAVTIMFAMFVVYPWKGQKATIDFFTGFLVEKSLSVDNLFVFLMLFQYFKVHLPPATCHLPPTTTYYHLPPTTCHLPPNQPPTIPSNPIPISRPFPHPINVNLVRNSEKLSRRQILRVKCVKRAFLLGSGEPTLRNSLRGTH